MGGVRTSEGALRAVGSIVWSLGILVFLVLLAVDLVALVVGAHLVFTGALAGGPRHIDLFVLAPFAVGERFDVAAEVFLAYFAVIVAAIVAAYVWFGYRDARPAAQAFARPIGDLRARLESKSAWISVGQVFLAAFAFQLMYILLLDATGAPPPPPSGGAAEPAWYLYYAYANAPVYEEVVTRWMFMGIPLFIVALVRAWTLGTPRALRASWRHLLGGTLNRESPRALVVTAVVTNIASAAIFSLAHVPGYGWWKFLPTMVAGLGMGYLFARRGLFAAILFHFAQDYFVAAILLAEANADQTALMGLGVLVFLILAFGAFFFIWYVVYAVGLADRLAVRLGWRRPAPVASASGLSYGPPPPPPPSQYASPYGIPPASRPPSSVPAPSPRGAYGAAGWVSFACQRCGWREARYDAGRFTCLRCGHESP